MRVLKCCAIAILWLGLCVEVFAQHGSGTAHGPLYGVDMIPPEAIQLTREQMRNLFVVSDAYSEGVTVSLDRLKEHNEGMREIGLLGHLSCVVVTTNNLSTTPFTFLARYPPFAIP